MGPLAALGRRLEARVPGLSCAVDSLADYGLGVLSGNYKCPCGELSRFAWGFRDATPLATDVEDALVEVIRRHVRGEGNEPGF